jgi:hypothetical protein
VSPDELATRVDGALTGAPVSVVTGAQDTADKQADMKHELAFFNKFWYSPPWRCSWDVHRHNTFSIVVASARAT